MSKKFSLANYEHPLVKKTAFDIIGNEADIVKQIERLFNYVKDDIKFGFTKEGDLTRASETIQYGIGQCNTKTVLFLALCKAVKIPARIHYSLIGKEIQKGIWTGIFYKLLPKELSHSWIEIEVYGNGEGLIPTLMMSLFTE